MLAAVSILQNPQEWVGVAVLAVIAWTVVRGGGSSAMSVLSEANKVLEKRVHELEVRVKEDAATIAELRARTDVAVALQPLAHGLAALEARAQQWHEKELSVLQGIADRLAA